MLATYSTNKIMVLKQYVSERRRKKEIDINQTNTRTHTGVCVCVLLCFAAIRCNEIRLYVYTEHIGKTVIGPWFIQYILNGNQKW